MPMLVAAVRCAPPANKPTPEERDTCLPFLRRELELLTEVEVVVALGQFAHQIMAGELGISPRPKFGHNVQATAPDGVMLVSSYHPGPTEHVHRHLDRDDARRGVHPGAGTGGNRTLRVVNGKPLLFRLNRR